MKRVLTALVLIPLVVGLIFLGPVLLVRAAIALTALLCLHEAFSIARAGDIEPFAMPAFVAGGLLVLLPTLPHPAYLIAFALLLLTLPLAGVKPLNQGLTAAATTLLMVVYTCGPFALAVHLHQLSPHWLLAVLLICWVGDSAAYFVGRAVGKHKLAPRLSPGKTWEGTIGSVVLATVAGAIYLQRVHPHDFQPWALLAVPVVINVAGQLGDLVESALKRGAGVKDSGTLLPGHGGMLDRMDGTLFAFPAAYLLVVSLPLGIE